jgi:hypothetical protein
VLDGCAQRRGIAQEAVERGLVHVELSTYQSLQIGEQKKARHTLHSPKSLLLITPPSSRRPEDPATPSRGR